MIRFILIIITTLLALAGCPSPNVYGTARTLPKGKSQHTLAFERFSVVGTDTSVSTTSLPTYQYRYGVSESADVGFRIANLTSIGMDVKWSLLRGTTDLAIDPGFTGTYVGATGDGGSTSLELIYVHLPLLVGLHPTANTTVVFSPGLGMAIATATASGNGDAGRFTGASTAFARFGVGLNLQATSSFAVHPEITALKYFGEQGELVTVGVGFSFGGMPRSDAEFRERDDNRNRALRLTADAQAAASEGDCRSARRSLVRIHELDREVERSAVSDPAVADCVFEGEEARLVVVRATYEACRQQRIEMGHRAMQITNLRERGRFVTSMPVCGDPPPPPRSNSDQIVARRRQAIDRFTATASAAAKTGNCGTAQKLDAHVRELDATLHDSIYVRDPDVARCLGLIASVAPPKPDPTTETPVTTTPIPTPDPSATPPTNETQGPTPDPTPPPAIQPAPVVPEHVDINPPVAAPQAGPSTSVTTVATPKSNPPSVIATLPAPTPFPRRKVAIALGGTSLLVGAVAVWAGLDARSKRDAAHDAGCNNDLSMCPPAGFALADEAHARGNLATGLLVGSGATLATAAVLWLTSPKPTRTTAWRIAPTRGLGFAVGKGF